MIGRRPVPPASTATACDDFEECTVPRGPSLIIETLRRERVAHGAPELKFYETTAPTGVMSQNTWSGSNDMLGNIGVGTAQNQRVGRVIRIKRLRVTFNIAQAAYTTLFGHCLLMRMDPSVSSSDLWASNGSARVVLLEPNHIAYRTLYSFTSKDVGQYAGYAGGTTPSYVTITHVIDQDFGKGVLARYDVGGAVLGPTPVPYFCVDESGLTGSVAYQVWYTDE